jgi:hypothetical protein
MKKFLVLYMAPVAAMQEMTKSMSPEQQKENMGKWMQWMEKNAAHFADRGAPAGKNTRVAQDGAHEISNDVMGYSIMQAESKEELLKILESSNHLEMSGAYTEVMECFGMPSM